MGEDLSTGAKIGIILIILCSLIAIVFALLTMMKNITNSGSSQLQSNLDQMMQTTFDDYNQKTVTGIQVKSALRIFESQDIAVVVKTGLCNTPAGGQFLGGFNYNALLYGYAPQPSGYKVAVPQDINPQAHLGTIDKICPNGGTGMKEYMDGYGDVFYSRQQINATAASVGDSTTIGTYDPNHSEYLKDGLLLHSTGAYYIGELYKQPGRTSVEFNYNTKPLDASSNKSYVRTSAKYRAMLIKDSAGANIGVLFNEIVTD